MAKLTGPLLSFGAKGQLGNAMVVSNWRGIDYARQYVVPANPRTTAQMANRTRFALLREMWKLAPAALQAPWNAFAQGRPFLPMNKFVGENNRVLNGELDMTGFIASPGARGGLPPTAFAAAPTAVPGEVEGTFTLPDQLPDGWTVEAVGMTAFPDQDPTGIFTGPLRAAEEAAPATEVTLADLPSGELCVVAGWVIYEKPDGKLAYSVSLADTATPL